MNARSETTVGLNTLWTLMLKVAIVTVPVISSATLAGVGWMFNRIESHESRLSSIEHKLPDELTRRLTVIETSAGNPAEWTKLVESIHSSETATRELREQVRECCGIKGRLPSVSR